MTIKIERGFDFGHGERYLYDTHYCASKDGWAQVDTRQDASYYGTWANPFKFTLANFAEGDLTITRCDTKDEFISALQECIDWNVEAGYWIGIDGMCRDEIIAEFTKLGFGNVLH